MTRLLGDWLSNFNGRVEGDRLREAISILIARRGYLSLRNLAILFLQYEAFGPSVTPQDTGSYLEKITQPTEQASQAR